VKLVVAEAESAALRDSLARDPDQFASAIVEVEVVRAVRRGAPDLLVLAQQVVSQLTVVEVSEAIRMRASLLEPAALRSLDALHISTALELGDDLDAVVTYDGRMAGAAASVGLHVVAPGAD
jgi:predicted nucleic acid-binding protein